MISRPTESIGEETRRALELRAFLAGTSNGRYHYAYDGLTISVNNYRVRWFEGYEGSVAVWSATRGLVLNEASAAYAPLREMVVDDLNMLLGIADVPSRLRVVWCRTRHQKFASPHLELDGTVLDPVRTHVLIPPLSLLAIRAALSTKTAKT